MTRSATIMSLAAATLGFALAFGPAAVADDMSHDSSTTKSDNMGTKKDDGMKKDTMSKDTIKKDEMKK